MRRAVLVVLLAVGACSSSAGARPAPGPSTDRSAAGIRALLTQRENAVRDGDERAWMATVDPADVAFAAHERQVFADLQALPLAGWHYDVAADGRITLSTRLGDFDDVPDTIDERLSFTSGPVPLLTSDASRPQAWDVGASAVTRGTASLVLHHPGDDARAGRLAALVDAAVPAVSAVWTGEWPRRAVVILPASATEAGELLGGSIGDVAAETQSELAREGSGDSRSGGDRIVIVPDVFDRATDQQRTIVVRHELTHVATRAFTTPAMPTWLVEGYADLVGFGSISPRVGAGALRTAVLGGHVPTTLPADADFRGTPAQVELAYESAWLACRALGAQRATAIYRLVGGGTELAAAVRQVTGQDLAGFIRTWRAGLGAELR